MDPLLGMSRDAREARPFFSLVEIYCVFTTALWSRDGSAVVSVHPPGQYKDQASMQPLDRPWHYFVL